MSTRLRRRGQIVVNVMISNHEFGAWRQPRIKDTVQPCRESSGRQSACATRCPIRHKTLIENLVLQLTARMSPYSCYRSQPHLHQVRWHQQSHARDTSSFGELYGVHRRQCCIPGPIRRVRFWLSDYCGTCPTALAVFVVGKPIDHAKRWTSVEKSTPCCCRHQ